MRFVPTAIADVVIVEPDVFGDARGFFLETWQDEKFRAGGIDVAFVQDNHSRSRQGILRGLHYQLTQPQGKLVRVVTGSVFDVAVDLRRASPTFGQWVGVELSEDNHRMLWVPPGFAHGFYVLSAMADFVYKCTAAYAPEDERCIRWDDPDLAIDWPVPAHATPLVSEKDAAGATFGEAEVYP
ncbi:dTDP-4-dehydrorhamnose 3,5-epimerase [Acidihalobacter ferrooxydans]|uniref:dTDP-4-dehydrorhamnose 3,5-epimerase n=1 Tax=Acidihalobacter ferrooxydans TaxID=1765967 RepID=A0A1P8UGF8_9GAMM|nr:dTDP-4-dehydrorhamnose 3,5-epimerase [Acidihalobacter ferrooxydans]APZ42909.1 dTDP-4-dehydrorhamnose 3,5-epimerase [Acidihalobacter ferrooxydans]